MPPRKRKITTEYNIKYVHNSNGTLQYRPYIKKKERHDGIKTDKGGFLKPPISIGKLGDDPDHIYQAYLIAKEQIKKQETGTKGQIGWIVSEYMKSAKWKQKAPSSQKRDQNLCKIINHPIKINGKQETLAELHLSALDKPIINAIAQKRLENYKKAGKKGEVQVNREITFLTSAISWALNNVPNLGIHINPLKGREKFVEPKNERYVSHQEYEIQYNLASDIRPYLQAIFEITYLTATRGVEVLDIKLSDCTEEGIRIHRRKGSRDNIITWSSRLRKAYDQALKEHDKHKIRPIDPYLIIGASSGQMAKGTLNAVMQELKREMTKKGLENIFWSLHKLKSKGMTDAKNKDISGLSEAMKRHYNKEIPKIKPAG